ncbi:unnamed protein product [Dracunculus medinensis]|uniref:Cap-specific mRNA (nucleoside-2'-O-)-methyltransferase 2 n=1 Tax=Dracunculus medinensis TaxID=318479 RepID=A0A0N4UQV5_DRAME|nr:unnamed protein product [Dracunculus medinensis]
MLNISVILLLAYNYLDLKCSLHLCEAPGAFVVALAIYLKLHVSEVHWSWRANSLNPYYEWNEPTNMILDDTLIAKSYAKWLFGPDNSGNIFNWTQNYLDYIVCKTGKFHLITADGSFNCQVNSSILMLFKFSLILTIQIALDLLRPNGSFVIKMYTIYRKETVETIFDLFTSFERLYMFKPSSSKPGNPEVSLIFYFDQCLKIIFFLNLSFF